MNKKLLGLGIPYVVLVLIVGSAILGVKGNVEFAAISLAIPLNILFYSPVFLLIFWVVARIFKGKVSSTGWLLGLSIGSIVASAVFSAATMGAFFGMSTWGLFYAPGFYVAQKITEMNWTAPAASKAFDSLTEQYGGGQVTRLFAMPDGRRMYGAVQSGTASWVFLIDENGEVITDHWTSKFYRPSAGVFEPALLSENKFLVQWYEGDNVLTPQGYKEAAWPAATKAVLDLKPNYLFLKPVQMGSPWWVYGYDIGPYKANISLFLRMDENLSPIADAKLDFLRQVNPNLTEESTVHLSAEDVSRQGRLLLDYESANMMLVIDGDGKLIDSIPSNDRGSPQVGVFVGEDDVVFGTMLSRDLYGLMRVNLRDHSRMLGALPNPNEFFTWGFVDMGKDKFVIPRDKVPLVVMGLDLKVDAKVTQRLIDGPCAAAMAKATPKLSLNDGIIFEILNPQNPEGEYIPDTGAFKSPDGKLTLKLLKFNFNGELMREYNPRAVEKFCKH